MRYVCVADGDKAAFGPSVDLTSISGYDNPIGFKVSSTGKNDNELLG
jgi:hypothetical protein